MQILCQLYQCTVMYNAYNLYKYDVNIIRPIQGKHFTHFFAFPQLFCRTNINSVSIFSLFEIVRDRKELTYAGKDVHIVALGRNKLSAIRQGDHPKRTAGCNNCTSIRPEVSLKVRFEISFGFGFGFGFGFEFRFLGLQFR